MVSTSFFPKRLESRTTTSSNFSISWTSLGMIAASRFTLAADSSFEGSVLEKEMYE